MDLDKVWLWYAGQRLGHEPSIDDAEDVSPGAAQGLIWDFNALFEERAAEIRASAPDEGDGADGALAMLAVNDSLDHWSGLTLPVLRVLYDRHTHAVVRLEMARQAGVKAIMSIPRGMDHRSRARTVWLRLMLGAASARLS
ncbi:hypothetical protein [Bradyrhizobium sp. BR 10289]|uniref:hypothetical protein n=1 Tax=Bradyrhizobium sp. BR 10289 TaxID=2749993 RepID=UPI001C64FE4D|nr:hypothetical protein [Bradyrhizobium sp. BR 10289]MBW7968144.1 hypothetical protein [Bradyrhizobium sp. BR 10289]